MAPTPATADLLARLEAISRERPDRVLRLRGDLPGEAADREPFELLIYRGFASSLSHPTAADPDQPALPAAALITAAELLAAPLNPGREELLGDARPVERFLTAAGWD